MSSEVSEVRLPHIRVTQDTRDRVFLEAEKLDMSYAQLVRWALNHVLTNDIRPTAEEQLLALSPTWLEQRKRQ